MKKTLAIVLAGAVLGATAGAAAQVRALHDHTHLSVLDILAAADKKRGDVHGAVWALNVAEADGSKTTLSVQAANHNFLAEYTAPAAQRGQKILQIGQNMWFVSPGASRPVPISPRQKLLGNASYGDIAGQRWSHDYRATDKFDTMENGRRVWHIDLVANTDKATYDAIRLYVDQEDLEAIRSEMLNSEGEVIKTATYTYGNPVRGRHESAREAFDNESLISEMVIEGRDGSKTTLTYSDVEFNPLSPQIFILSNVIQN